MANQWGYVDPAERAHQLRAQRASYEPLPYVQPTVFPLQPVQSPLGWLDQVVPQVNAMPRPARTAERMATGAVLGGLLGVLFARRQQRKAQRIQDLKASLGISDVE